MKPLPIIFLTILIVLCLFPAKYNVVAKAETKSPVQVNFEPVVTHYTQEQIDQMTAGTFHPYILRTLIKCESQNTNQAEMDSNGLMSYGILQFNGNATWDSYAKLAGVSSTPMNPLSAIRVADYMISVGQLHRWSCAYITGLLK